MKKLLAILLAGAMLFGLTACASGTEKAAAESTSGGNTAATGQTSSSAVDPADLTIAIMGFQENQWSAMLTDGMKAACDEYGINYIFGNYSNDNAKEAELVSTYTTIGVDAILSSPSTTSGLDLYREPAEAGIRVGLCNVVLDGDADFVDVYYGYTQSALGEGCVDNAAAFIKENLDSKPVIMTMGIREGSIAQARTETFLAGMKEIFGEEAATPVASVYGVADADAAQAVSDALTANPDINFIFCEFESAAIGAISAIETAGLTGKVFVAAVDCSELMCNMMLEENPILIACASQDPYLEGYYTAADMCQILLGTKESSHGEVVYMDASPLCSADPDAIHAYLDYLKSFSEN